ncbi:MAG: hypothetical protein Q9159_005580 [Coniocarpon cinnabarinum]
MGSPELPRWTRDSASIRHYAAILQSRRWLGLLAGSLVALFFLSTSSWQPGPATSPRQIITQGWRKVHDSAGSKENQFDGLRNFRKEDGCNFTSLNIHHPFAPACTDRSSLLDAMSGGGRLGWDTPYWTRGCDMQWFTIDEVCDILSRYDHIYLIGDDMLRHLGQALHVFMRGDLWDGGRATWREGTDDNDCHCHNVFDKPACIWWSAVNTVPLLQNAPMSVQCKQRPALVSWDAMLNYPLNVDLLKGVVKNIENKADPNGRDAFIVGHGLWNDLNVETTMSWLEQIENEMALQMPAYFEDSLANNSFPRLFISPSAQGESNTDTLSSSENNLQLMRHTREVSGRVKSRGFEHLALYNMSVQASSPDGTHTSYENNLLKAMFVLNWLNMLEPPDRSAPPVVPTTSVSSPVETLKPEDLAEEPMAKQHSADSLIIQTIAADRTGKAHASSKATSVPAAGETSSPPPSLQSSAASKTRPGSHPIDQLILEAEDYHNELMSKRTHGVHDAAQAYRQRRGRHPPPRFDKFVKWCEERDVVMVEDYFDQIYGDLAPFWAVEPRVIRDFPKSWMNVLSIRNGVMRRWDDEPPNIANWMDFWGTGLQALPLEDLPDVDIAFNGEDEPKMFVPYEEIQEAIAKAEKRRLKHPVDDHLPSIQEYVELEPLPLKRPPVKERDGYEWAEFPEDKPLWDAGRAVCPPHSKARKANGNDDFSKTPHFPHAHNLIYMHEGFVSNWSAAKSSCDNPHLRGLHGTWIGMLSSNPENPKPAQKAIISDLVPMLSGCKIHDINAEILVPPAMQWPSDADSSDFTFNFKEDQRIPWEKKEDLVMWRGSASGGVNDADNWTRFQRHRFLSMLNGTLVSQHEATQASGNPIPSHVPGGHPALPWNFPLPQVDVYDLATMQATSPSAALESWINSRVDAAFIHLRCFPPPSWFHGNGQDCPYNGEYYTVKPVVKSTEAYKYKYQPDLDGASYSGRYRSILQDSSLPIKATIYDEWHDSRLVPWKHFVPMDNTYMDWYGIMEYFLGYAPSTSMSTKNNDPKSIGEEVTVVGDDAEARAGHDEVAKKIAMDGSEWTRTALRNEDMLAYVYRLILEIARLGDERRDEMGFAADLK